MEDIFLDTIQEWMKKTMNQYLTPWMDYTLQKKLRNLVMDMTRKKCHILDCVLDTFPEHLKTKAKHMCDILKCKDRLFIYLFIICVEEQVITIIET